MYRSVKVILAAFVASALVLSLWLAGGRRGVMASSPQKDGRPLLLETHGITGSPASLTFVRTMIKGQIVCRVATPEEAGALLSPPEGFPLNAFPNAERISPHQTGLQINLRSTTQLDSNQQAKAAYQRAADAWKALIQTPISIVIDVDFGPNQFGEPWPQDVIGATRVQTLGSSNVYNAVRQSLIDSASNPQETALYGSLPTENVTTDLGTTAAVSAPSATFRALGLISAQANPDTEAANFGPPPRIAFNSNLQYDFDPSNGIDAGKIDFQGAATHEIGHALGFASNVGLKELSPTSSVDVSLWDIFRFRPGVTSETFATSQRILSSGGEQRFFGGGNEVALSTGRADGTGGDGEQASHWKDDDVTGQYVGVMDPTARTGQTLTITDSDRAVIDIIGYTPTGAVIPPPPNTVALISGQTQTGSIVAPEPDFGVLGSLQYSIQVPADATELRIDLNGTQDIDLLVKFGQRLFVDSEGDVEVDYLSDSLTGTESVTINAASTPPLRAGPYYIAIANYGPGASEFTLTATLTRPPGGNATPAVTGFAASLDGDVLTLTGTATDADGDIVQAQSRTLDAQNREVSSTPAFNTNFGNLANINFRITTGNLNAFPTATKATLVLIDSRGNRSAEVVADFSQADPGGPTIYSVSYSGSKMTFKGRELSGQVRVFINGVEVKSTQNDSGKKLKIKGNAAALNVRAGANRIRVQVGTLRSNIVILDR